MQAAERLLITSLLLMLFVIGLGTSLYLAPRFPGSFVGSLIGIVAAILMIISLGYALAKRVASLRLWLSRYVSGGTVLQIHVFTGGIGILLAIVHSGNAMRSGMGLLLGGLLVAVVVTGYVGRYYIRQLVSDLGERTGQLADLRRELHQTTGAPGSPIGIQAGMSPGTDRLSRTMQVIEAVADLEYTTEAEQAIRRVMKRWLVVHTVVAITFLATLTLHVWSEFYLGLRWLG